MPRIRSRCGECPFGERSRSPTRPTTSTTSARSRRRASSPCVARVGIDSSERTGRPPPAGASNAPISRLTDHHASSLSLRSIDLLHTAHETVRVGRGLGVPMHSPAAATRVRTDRHSHRCEGAELNRPGRARRALVMRPHRPRGTRHHGETIVNRHGKVIDARTRAKHAATADLSQPSPPSTDSRSGSVRSNPRAHMPPAVRVHAMPPAPPGKADSPPTRGPATCGYGAHESDPPCLSPAHRPLEGGADHHCGPANVTHIVVAALICTQSNTAGLHRTSLRSLHLSAGATPGVNFLPNADGVRLRGFLAVRCARLRSGRLGPNADRRLVVDHLIYLDSPDLP
ncbi:hypothetical protein F4559_001445 [Saccharothrix violaceirubra]|uniref:Uncharacterized protein n=1 Tax=Saccharothrix violaceirubra TaxID=413306 RepID=A0A7W7T003_9PSEU|nr:hypothetical protein [Saccharothrix violaceirubra]